MRNLLVSFLVLSFVACESNDVPSTPMPDSVADLVAVPDALPDAASVSDAVPDTAPDILPTAAESCIEALTLDRNWTLFPDAESTQIHPVVEFDGEAFWVSWSAPEPEGVNDSRGFDIWAARVACDGSYLVEPFRVTEDDHGNELDSDIAVSGDRVFVTWQADTGGDPNLFIWWRGFEMDGTPLGAEQQVVVPNPGTPVSAWMPRIARDASGGFVIVGTYANAMASSFQVFGARYDAEGTAVPFVNEEGNGLLHFPQVAMNSNNVPDVTTSPNGYAYVGWLNSRPAEGDEYEDEIWWSRVSTEGTGLDPVGPPSVGFSREPASHPSLSAVWDDLSPVYLAAHRSEGEMDILVSELRNPMAHRTVLELGVPDKMDHSPVVAAGDKGGAVAWYRVRSGYKNDVLVQGFAYDGESFRVPYSATMVTELGDEHAAPPYWPAIAHIDANHYFVVWAEGANPDFFVVGRFVDLGE